MVGEEVVFSHKSDNWGTPQDLFDRLNLEFSFTLDGAADESNHKLDRWLGPGSSFDLVNALEVNVTPGERVFLNPPYSMTGEFMEWIDQNRTDNLFVCLVPARTDTKWFHRYVWNEKLNKPRGGVEIRFIKGRVKFKSSEVEAKPNSAPFPSVIIIFRGNPSYE